MATSGKTVDWLAQVMYEAKWRAATELYAPQVPFSVSDWATLSDVEREIHRRALTAALEALGDPTLLKLRQGEPIFVLRSQDAVAPRTVGYWIAWAEGMGAPREKLAKAVTKAEQMQAWRAEHPALVKVPD